MQWQHGTFTKLSNGNLQLQPFSVDGRQLTSDPCQSKTSVLMRYNETETFDVGAKVPALKTHDTEDFTSTTKS
jgi:hypothetical protein